ncbi:hypothetical protein EDB89DRAFT_2015642 [Lactarius sanguifluus]|nr:hypothetical protein EDB89DRAFT_2015642 [Lactarius sanguifluus]
MFRIPFLTTEDRRAKFGRHRFAVSQDLRKEVVCLYSSACDSICIQGGHDNQGFSHPSQATQDAETVVRRPATPHTARWRVVSGFVIVVFIARVAISQPVQNPARVPAGTTNLATCHLRRPIPPFQLMFGLRRVISVWLGCHIGPIPTTSNS